MGEPIVKESSHWVEVHNPGTSAWTPGAELITGRRDHTNTLLHDGRILVIGGWNQEDGDVASLEAYEPSR